MSGNKTISGAQRRATHKARRQRRELAALEVARDYLPDEAIAEQVGIDRVTLYRWKQQPSFRAMVQAHLDLWAQQLRDLGLADRRNRVENKNLRHQKLMQIVEARSGDPLYADHPGGATGFLVRQLKQIGTGPNSQIVEEFAVDKPLLRELSELETEVAKELGQWTERLKLETDEWMREYAKAHGVSEDEAQRLLAEVARG